ncbi:MAG: hypothetical protein NXI22_11715 [bacterium]|nr:hypothetical protein [bacterium]
MDNAFSADAASSSAVGNSPQIFIGRWNRLVSSTNWDKGRIIHDWRESLIASEASPPNYSDEAWATTVGGVTGQHVGRLRRVFARFGETQASYDGLFWSHFQAAIDWDDAEMWLEGAVQNRWSVSAMRNKRWETLDGDEANRPNDADLKVVDLDEDFEPAKNESPDGDFESKPLTEGPDFGDEPQDPGTHVATANDGVHQNDLGDTAQQIRPFESLPELPADVLDAFESMKLALLRHKSQNWQDITHDDFLSVLESLKQLASAPS